MLPADGADVSVGVLFDGHLHGGVGQEFLDEFWPLDETEGAAVEVIVEADVVGFFEAAYAVEVEVKDRSPL